jgi:predicted amidohydrolase
VRDLTLSLVQTPLHWHDPTANRAAIETLLDATPRDSGLVVLPEMFTTGFTMDAAAQAETMQGYTLAWLREQAAARGQTLTGSLVIEDQGRYFNRLIWMPPDGKAGWYDKRHLFRMAGEQEVYTAGRARRIFCLGDWRVLPLVCYDLRFPVWSRGADQFDLLLYVANWPAARRSAWTTLLPARAVENLCYAAGVNRVGSDARDIDYAGDSGAWDFFGNSLIDAGDTAGVFTITLGGARLMRYREKFPAHHDADRFSLADVEADLPPTPD